LVWAVAFLAVELVVLVLVLLALTRVGIARLESAAGIWRDGLPRGATAPAWEAYDLEGRAHQSPSRDKWQVLIFSDHSLAAFPSLVTGMKKLPTASPNVEVLLMSRDGIALSEITARTLDLHTPILANQHGLDRRFRVRVAPYAFVIDPAGVVRWLGLVNTEDQLFHMARMAQAGVRNGDMALGAPLGSWSTS
jgi:hypothetical protein